MSTKIINQVGLEAEFFVTNKKGEVLYPMANGFDCDEFIILGEFRAKPGKTRSETIGNFMQSYYEVQEIAKKRKVVINLDGIKQISSKKNAEILRKMGSKVISESKNIHGTDILELSDNVIKGGKIIGRSLSTGFHVHFSSTVEDSRTYSVKDRYYYSEVELPIVFNENLGTSIKLYKRGQEFKQDEQVIKVSVSRITKPVLNYFVKEMDKKLLTMFLTDELKSLKFRNPGFYEMKCHGGFEYRSLPFNYDVLENIFHITDFAFNLLEEL